MGAMMTESKTVGDAIEEMEMRARQSNIIPASKFFANPPPPMEWTVKNLIPKNSFTILGGVPKTSKSWVALEFALSVASGTPAFGSGGFATDGHMRPVLLMCLEDNPHNIYARLRALGQAKGISMKELSRLPIWFRFDRKIDLAQPGSTGWVISAIKESLPSVSLIVIDPFRNSHTSDENDSAAITRVTDHIRDIRDATQASVLVVHHLRKPTRSEEGTPWHALRGSGAIHGAVDGATVMISKDGQCGGSRWTNLVYTKVKTGRESDPFELVLSIKDGPDGRAQTATWEVSPI